MGQSLGLTASEMAGGAHLVRVSGEVDLATAPQLLEALVQFTDGDVHVDLSDVTYLESSGVAALANAHKAAAARGERLIVHGARANVLLVLQITGMDEVLHLDGQAPAPDGP